MWEGELQIMSKYSRMSLLLSFVHWHKVPVQITMNKSQPIVYTVLAKAYHCSTSFMA